jgi:hypothetical protein
MLMVKDDPSSEKMKRKPYEKELRDDGLHQRDSGPSFCSKGAMPPAREAPSKP